MKTNNYNACRNYAKTWCEGLGRNHTAVTKKSDGGYISSVYNGDDYIGKLDFNADGTTTWSEWQDGSGYSYTQDIDPWKED